ncbi:hypothetical protein [Bilophila wadsworthia]|uniref:hypothetical protein n=1 Tax=Bilophila wadsworthia TaxID=35833 RepID=UPI00242AA88D|nr:hypothetical protein [Bilophila wadsworthia]
MAIFTKAEKARQIALWQEALEKVSRGQEYTMGTRRCGARTCRKSGALWTGWTASPPWRTCARVRACRASCRWCRAAAGMGAADGQRAPELS